MNFLLILLGIGSIIYQNQQRLQEPREYALAYYPPVPREYIFADYYYPLPGEYTSTYNSPLPEEYYYHPETRNKNIKLNLSTNYLNLALMNQNFRNFSQNILMRECLSFPVPYIYHGNKTAN